MFSALMATLFAGLAGTSAACVVLWRRVRALILAFEATEARGSTDGAPPVSVVLPKGPSRPRNDDLARRFDELLGRHRDIEARLAKLEDPATSAPIERKPARRADPPILATSAGPTLISVPDLAAPPGSTSEAAAELDRRFGPVWGMADEGTPVDAIARETGYPIGQVELILGLRRRLVVAEAGPDA